MKTVRLISTLIFILVINMHCTKEESEPASPQNNFEDVYYIKYEVQSKSIYIANRYSEIVGENNSIKSFNFSSNNWTITIGPVKKGFNASIKTGYTNPNLENSTIDAFIYVSKNNAPFALKKYDQSSSNRTLVQLFYNIDI